MDINSGSYKRKSAKKNIVWGIVNRLVAMLLPFINRTVLIYALGTSYLGLDGLFSSILQMLNIAEIGFSSAIIFSMYKPIANHDDDQICALLGYYRNIYRKIGIVILTAGLALCPFLPHLIKSDLPQGLNLYVLYIIYLLNTSFGYWLFSYKKALISAFQQENILSNINTVINILKTVLQVALLFLFKNYYLYICILPVTTVLENLYIEIISKKRFPQYICRGIIPEELRLDIKKRIQGLFISKVCSTSRNSLDNIILSAFIGLNAVAIYGNYYTIMSSVHIILTIIPNGISAAVGNGIATQSRESNYQNMIKFNFIYMWISGLCTIYLLCLYQPFITLWLGNSFLLPMYIVIAICIYNYSLSLGDIRSLYTTGAGLWWEGRYRSIAEAVTNIVLNIVLGKIWGIFGIVVATIISIIGINFLYGSSIVFRFYFKNGKLGQYYKKQLYYMIITILASFLTYRVCLIFSGTLAATLLVRVVICTIVPNVVYLLLFHWLPEYKESILFALSFLHDSKLKSTLKKCLLFHTR